MNDEFSTSGMAGEVITQSTLSDRSKGSAALLALFLGTFGVHRFYLGRAGSGAIMLVFTLLGIFTSFFLIGFAIIAFTAFWAFIDFIRILVGGLTDGQGRKLR